MRVRSASLVNRIVEFLDSPPLRLIGGLLTLWAVVALLVGLAGRVAHTSYQTGANILIAAGGVGLLIDLMALMLRLFAPPLSKPPIDHDRRDGEEGALVGAIESELVELIDEWKALRPSEFAETANAPYNFLLHRTSEFLGTILGRAEAQRFEDGDGERSGTLNELVDLRVRALSLLRDASDRWQPRVDLPGLSAAVIARKEIDYGSAILIAGSPLESHYDIPADPVLLASQTQAEANDEREEDHDVVAVLTPGDDLEDALRTERAEGTKLLNALKGGFLERWQYDRAVSTDDVRGWQLNVEHLLHHEEELLQLFRWQPLTRTMGFSWTSVADVLQGGPEVRRLEGLLTQLDKVIARLAR